MSHPAVVKATKIANRAVAQGWKGTLDSQVVGNGKYRKTVLFLERNDECLVIDWRNSHFDSATYSMFDSIKVVDDLLQIKQIVMGWPDILELFSSFPHLNKPTLVAKYRRLPFDWETDSDETILKTLVGKQIWWYDHESAKRRTDTVLRRQNAKYRIAPVGHRKLFHFNGSHAGFCSVLLDTIIKVA